MLKFQRIFSISSCLMLQSASRLSSGTLPTVRLGADDSSESSTPLVRLILMGPSNVQELVYLLESTFHRRSKFGIHVLSAFQIWYRRSIGVPLAFHRRSIGVPSVVHPRSLGVPQKSKNESSQNEVLYSGKCSHIQ